MFWGKAFINPHSSMAWANMMERACFYREPCFPYALLTFSNFDPFSQKAADDESQRRKQPVPIRRARMDRQTELMNRHQDLLERERVFSDLLRRLEATSISTLVHAQSAHRHDACTSS